MQPLPDWAEPPIDVGQAATALGISRASLDAALKEPNVKAGVHFELRGNRKVFYRENITAMRKVLTQCASKSPQGLVRAATTTLTGMAPTVRESDALLRLRTLAAQKN